MEIATLVIAIIGLILAVVSLLWQAATFVLSGPRVKVRLREGIRGDHGGALLGPIENYTADGLAALTAQGYSEHVLGIEVVNTGRLPATIRTWGLRFGNRAVYTHNLDPRNPPLPHRLEPATSEVWYVPVANLQELQGDFVDQSREAATARADVDLATGKTVSSRDGFTIRPDEIQLVRPLAARVRARPRPRS